MIELIKKNKINIFAGFNNSGKTSLLEAVYLLTKQNDIASFFELIRLKNKLQLLNPIWLNQTFHNNIEISGCYNDIETNVKMEKFEAKDIDKKDDYITSYKLQSIVDNRVLDNIVHTFGYETLRRENEKVEYLCNSIIKSPYYYNLNEILKTHEKSLRYKDENHKTAIDMIVEFAKKIDSDIRYIELSEIDDSIKRFIVDADTSVDNLDITNYGEGLQRIFEIALSFAFCKNGVICIDEFETAIHYSLLVDFTRFVQELADMFNVQVFITTHSKECISAFIENDYSNDEISFYTMTRDKNKEIQSIYYDADSLKSELDQDAEVRGW
jgi:AAA15 family ATPase/GTPase